MSRFFMDHGMIHDRVSGQHIHTDPDVEPGAKERLFILLQQLEANDARYRWLRENTYVEGYWLDGAGGVDTKIRVQGSLGFLDAVIDVAKGGQVGERAESEERR